MSYIERVGERCLERGLGGELKKEGKRDRERRLEREGEKVR